MTITPIIFCKIDLVFFFNNLILFAKNIKKTTINGRRIPFVICANFIISIGLIPIEEKITPTNKTTTAIILK